MLEVGKLAGKNRGPSVLAGGFEDKDQATLRDSTLQAKLRSIVANPDYAVRFVNLGEYISVISRQTVEPREARLFSLRANPNELPLTRYLGLRGSSTSSHALGKWVGSISLQTETALHYSVNLQAFAKLRGMLSSAHQEAIELSTTSVGDRTRANFTRLLREDYQERNSRYFPGRSYYERLHQSIRQGERFLESVEAVQDSEECQRVVDELHARREAMEVLERVNRRELLTLSKEEIRVLFLAINFAGWEQPIEKNSGLQWRQYQIALVFDAQALTEETSWGLGGLIRGWRVLRAYDDFHPDHLLAAVALVPDKRLWGIMKDYVETSGHFVHPLFTHHGRLLLPSLSHLPAYLAANFH